MKQQSIQTAATAATASVTAVAATSATAAQPSPAHPALSISTLPACAYGAQCTRQNPDHHRTQSHPCKFGAACTRNNPDHFAQYSHPPELTQALLATTFSIASPSSSLRHGTAATPPLSTIAPHVASPAHSIVAPTIASASASAAAAIASAPALATSSAAASPPPAAFAILPCDAANTYTTGVGGKRLSRWYLFTSCAAALSDLSTVDAVLEFFRAIHPDAHTDFGGLRTLLVDVLSVSEHAHFLSATLPGMVHLALQLPLLLQERTDGGRIPLLMPGASSCTLCLSRPLVASLLCCAFFCLVPEQTAASFPSLSFFSLLTRTTSEAASSCAKLRCFVHYFSVVTSRRPFPPGPIVLIRQSLSESVDAPLLRAQHEAAATDSIELRAPRLAETHTLIAHWQSQTAQAAARHHLATAAADTASEWHAWLQCSMPLCALVVEADDAVIEDAPADALQIDFANKFLGGGVLSRGCVQEEIRFAIAPELLVSMLFCAELGARDSLLMLGAERFSRYTGYASSFRFAGAYDDNHAATLRTQISAIDAVHFDASPAGARSQYHAALALRELNKALVGFMRAPPLPRASGWGGDGGSSGSGGSGGSSNHTDIDRMVDVMDNGGGAGNTGGDHDGGTIDIVHGDVATGNWGAGAFNGHAPLKALLQWAAASAARRPALRYFTFARAGLADGLRGLAQSPPASVGDLLRMVVCACSRIQGDAAASSNHSSVATSASFSSASADAVCAALPDGELRRHQTVVAPPTPDTLLAFVCALAQHEACE